MYHMDDEDGRVAVLLPAGVLFRGGAEDKIRKYIVKTMNRVDAVVITTVSSSQLKRVTPVRLDTLQ